MAMRATLHGSVSSSVVTGTTFTVAASDSAYPSRADYKCDGTADDVEIQQAVDALPAGGGKIILMEGTFSLDAGIVIGISNVLIEGAGTATVISTPALAEDFFSFTDMTNVRFENFTILGTNQTAGGGINAVGTCTGSNYANVTVSGTYLVPFVGILRESLNETRVSTDSKSRTYSSNVAVQANAAQADITVVDGTEFFVGQGIAIEDAAPQMEFANIESIAGNVLTVATPLQNTYLMVNTPSVRGRETQGIQEAINSVPLAPDTAHWSRGHGATVYIPLGEYLIDGIFIDELRNIWLTGAGNGATRLYLDDLRECPVIQVGAPGFSGVTRLRGAIRDVEIYGNLANQVGGFDGILLAGDCHGYWINSIKVVGASRDACRIGGGSRDVFITNSEFEDSDGTGLNVTGISYYMLVQNNYFHGNSQYGVWWGDWGFGSVFTGNIISRNYQHGLRLAATNQYLPVNGNTFYENGRGANNTYYDLMVDAGRVTINGNVFASDTPATKMRACVYLAPGANVSATIEGNIMHSWVTAPIIDTGANGAYYNRYTDLFQDCLTLDANHVVAAEDLSAGSPIVCGLAAQSDVPRTFSWVLTHAQITEYTMAFVGVDASGNGITETVTEADGWAGETGNAFATITSITFTRDAGTGAGDTLDVGIADKLGLSNPIDVAGDVYKVKKNTLDYSEEGASITTDATYNTVDVGTGAAIVGGDDFTIWCRSNMNIVS